jgi:hypothetical protein
MRVVKERRSPDAWRLRVYVDALQQAEMTTEEQWFESWLSTCAIDTPWVPLSTWVNYLRQCVIFEASKMVDAA